MKLKTKVISAICAGALALSMPAMALAAAPTDITSPVSKADKVYGENATATSSDAAGITLDPNGLKWNNQDYADMDSQFGITAQHFLGGVTVTGTTLNKGLNAKVTVVVKLMNKVKDGTYTACVKNVDGTNTSWWKQSYTVNDGYATIVLSKFSTNYVSFTDIAWDGTDTATGDKADTTKTSPKTGIAA